jgi:serine protease Do
MYNDNENERSNYEYHYSYRPESGEPIPALTPVEPKKRGRGKKIVAGVLCGALLIGGSVGAGWMLKDVTGGRGETQVMVSERELAKVETVSVSGGKVLTFPEIYNANVDSCVSINSSSVATGYNIFGQKIQQEAISSGSGFVLTADGYIATNCHVVSGASSVQVTLNDGTTYDATVVGSDVDYDIAVLKVDPGETMLKPVVIGSSAGVNVGESVCTIGNPLGELTFSLTHGIVSCVDREINLDGTPFNMIQVDTAINPGNSGGPLFNDHGEVVGIVTAKTSSAGNGTAAEGLGFAIPIDDVMNMLKDIMENGQVTTHAYMGVSVDNASRYPQTGVRSGAYLYEVVEGGPADQAGLQAGDVITMVGTTTITSSTDVTNAVGSKSYKAGDTATITYVRDGQVYTTDLTFGSTMDKPQTTATSSQDGQQQSPDTTTPSDSYPYGMEEFFRRYFGGMAS